MCKMKIVEEHWFDEKNNRTYDSIYLDKEGLYTVSDLIHVLKIAQEKFGDLEITIEDLSLGFACGFSRVCKTQDLETGEPEIHIVC